MSLGNGIFLVFFLLMGCKYGSFGSSTLSETIKTSSGIEVTYDKISKYGLKELVGAIGIAYPENKVDSTKENCSVTHIGLGYVSLAAHCVVDTEHDEYRFMKKPVRFTHCETNFDKLTGFIFWNHRVDHPAQKSSVCIEIPFIMHHIGNGIDVAIMKVSNPPKHLIPISLKYYEFKKPMIILAHPKGNDLTLSRCYNIEPTNEYYPEQLANLCYTDGGSSGASYIGGTSGSEFIVGIHFTRKGVESVSTSLNSMSNHLLKLSDIDKITID